MRFMLSTRRGVCVLSLRELRSVGVVWSVLLSAGCGGASTVRPSEMVSAPQRTISASAKEEYFAGVRELGLLRSQAASSTAAARARAHFLKAIELEPTLWEAHFNLGILARDQGEWEQARDHLVRAYRTRSSSPEVVLAYAEVLHAVGDMTEAVEVLTSLVQQRPGELAGRVALAAYLREQRQLDAAMQHARDALVRDPSYTPALIEMGRIHRALRQLEVADLVLEKASNIDPKNPLVPMERGLVAFDRGDTQRAFEYFDRATTLDPQDGTARLNQAAILLRAGDFAQAASEYRRVLSVDGNHIDARVGLGVALRGLGKHQEAKEQYDRVLKSQPKHPAALFNLGVLQADFLNQRSQAKATFEQFLDLSAIDPTHRKEAERYVREIASESMESRGTSKTTGVPVKNEGSP
jgi:tetratricopeptide (TPR) repeat protein